ncbi:MAG: CCA tRNA nucleotidyltransferase, partial [Candidatus Omnitrophica bacterium]|nr:CCA tRNA nucleotidyltransferase [Candidatus Omnitrophota bacterium]
EKTVKMLIRRLLDKEKEKKRVPFLNGNDIMRKFKLPPGPLIGKVLYGLEEAQAIGKIGGKKDAFKLAAKLVKLKR